MANIKGVSFDKKTIKRAHRAIRSEITEHYLYTRLARSTKDPSRRDALMQIAQAAFHHYKLWQDAAGHTFEPNENEIRLYYWMAKLFGVVFVVRLRDFFSGRRYAALDGVVPHETYATEAARYAVLRNAIDDERLHYMGAVVMGLNDAIVEITGAIAGFTLALLNTRLIALAGLITGFSGALSMASSEYLEKQSESDALNPIKAAGYTGGSYLLTAVILVAPYLLLGNYLYALVVMLSLAFVVIIFFSFYSTFLFDQKFRHRFPQMVLMSFGVALVSFLIGSVLRIVLHIGA